MEIKLPEIKLLSKDRKHGNNTFPKQFFCSTKAARCVRQRHTKLIYVDALQLI